MPTTRHPRGQVLIITAFAMIVLLAIAAIVVDLGFSWMLHRKEQNAVDPGSLAAAKWINPSVDQGRAEAEACFYAQENGFFVGDLNCDTALHATGDLDVNSPPSSTLSGDFRGLKGYVEVIIRSTHPSFFGQVFGRPFATVTTAAVASNTPGNANSSALTALGEDCSGNTDNGVSTVSGGAHVRIFKADPLVESGGYVQVNATCGNSDDVCANGSGTNALKISGILENLDPLPAPFTNVVGGCSYQGTGPAQPWCDDTLAPCLHEGAIPLGDPMSTLLEPWPFLNLPSPACPWISGQVNVNGPSDDKPCNLKGGNGGTCPLVGTAYTCTMSPGVYYAGWDIQSNVKVVLKPGMYVFAGFGIKLSNTSSMETVGDQAPDGTPIEARITIFSTDYHDGCLAGKQNFCEGDITFTAQGALNLKATDKDSCLLVSPTICTWRGLLIWQDGTKLVHDAGDVTINGGSDLILSGTIYAPESNVKITGGNGSTGCTVVPGLPEACMAVQIISESWDISGNATVDMPYDPDELFTFVQRGLVH
jgi:hypothetical protein